MAPDDCPPQGYVADYVSFWAIWVVLLLAAWIFFFRLRGRAGAMRLVVGNLLVFLSALWTIVLGAETYLRFIYDRTDQYGLTMTNRAWFGRHCLLNSHGFRDREFATEKAKGVSRVGFLGDSFAFGWGIENVDDAFPGLVRSALDARSPGRYEVLDLGEPGFSTTDEANMLDNLAPSMSFDHVVLQYCLNDPDNFIPAAHTFDRETAPRLPWFRQTWSFVADYLWFHLRLRADPRVKGYFEWEKEAYEDPGIWGLQTRQFQRIVDRCRASSIRLDVAVLPFFQKWNSDGTYEFDFCHDQVAAAWKKLGVDVIDLRDAYRGIPGSELVVNRFDAHPNARVHAIAAKVILDRAFDVR